VIVLLPPDGEVDREGKRLLTGGGADCGAGT
jgi:hypothetical protein